MSSGRASNAAACNEQFVRLNLRAVHRGDDRRFAFDSVENSPGECERRSARCVLFQSMMNFMDRNIVLGEAIHQLRGCRNGVGEDVSSNGEIRATGIFFKIQELLNRIEKPKTGSISRISWFWFCVCVGIGSDFRALSDIGGFTRVLCLRAIHSLLVTQLIFDGPILLGYPETT